MARPNLLTRLADYYDSTFPGRLNYARGTAIATLVAVSANSLRTDVSCPLKTRGNVYILLCGVSGSGKTSIIKTSDDLLDAIGHRNILTSDITPETFPKFLNAHKYALMDIREMTSLLGSYKKKAYMAGLREMLIQAWDGTTLTQARSSKESSEARNYSFSVIGDSQPGSIAEVADEVDVQSGFLPRFIWFLQKHAPKPSPHVLSDAELKIRSQLIDDLQTMFKLAQRSVFYFKFSQNQVDQIHLRLQNSAGRELHMYQPFYERMTDYVYKFAMIHMFGSDVFLETLQSNGFGADDETLPDTEPDLPEEDAGDWAKKLAPTTDMVQEAHKKDMRIQMHADSVEWAIEFIQEYTDKVLPDVIKILNLNDAEKARDAVARYEKEEDGKPMPESYLFRALGHEMRELNRIRNAIALAQKMGLIEMHRVRGGVNWTTSKEFVKGVEDYVGVDDSADEGKSIIDNGDDEFDATGDDMIDKLFQESGDEDPNP